MVTAICSLSNVHGAEIWLLFGIACVLAYLGICFMVKINRTKKGIQATLIGLLIGEIVIDFVWSLIYYHRGVYINYGVGAVYGLLMWIPILTATCIIVTIRNKGRQE